MKLFLTRHGETNLNLKRKFYGSLDVPIDNKGFEQANELADKLRSVRVETCYTSELQRAIQTATIIQSENQFGFPIMKLSNLNEMGFGRWEGLDADEIQNQDPVAWQRWLDDPFGVKPPEAEGYVAFKKRVRKVLVEILNQSDEQEPVLVVAHLGTLRVINQYFFPEVGYFDALFPAGKVIVIDSQTKARTEK
ncbi:histidine phosphatase family protein [Lentilactobacillus sp. Marseille-Q4993]|uniref:histidine phosphatase family protein n=1 Tax=Lentilactobacillus sp. Marseille-Q4993 TaxID=3039492 RepID=UPI0024BC3D53|nr:histidine phosphatase family protein [Lentilactobacillus sp. Marseille-Q4993]